MTGESSTVAGSLRQLPERVIRPRKGLIGLDWSELWAYRELFFFLAWRNVLIRYKQTYLGFLWAILQPLLTALGLYFAIYKALGSDAGGSNPLLITFTGTVLWVYFATAVSEGSGSMLAASNMVSKVYFPRIAIPLSTVLSGIIDFLISLFTLLLPCLIFFKVGIRLEWVFIPLFLAMVFLSSAALAFWFSALNVKYRDVKYVIPFIVRIGVLISPVGMANSKVIQALGDWAWVYYLNPLAGAINGFRWCILGSEFALYWPGIFTSTVVTLLLAVTGLFYFRNTEKTFADNI